MKKRLERLNRKLDAPILGVFSFIGAVLGAWAGSILGNALARSGTVSAMVGNGLFFLLVFAGGCLGMKLALSLRHITVELPGRHMLLSVGCIVLIFLIGAGGQWFFMMDTEEYTIQPETNSVDMVLLLDGSASMDSLGYQEARNSAAAEFIESLEEDTQLQVMGYHGGIISEYTSDLLEMTDTNKQTLVDLVSSMDSVGTTNYDTALEAALDTLTGTDAREDSTKAVILLTDGYSGDLSDDVIDAFEVSGAMLFTVRITGSSSDTEIADLVDLAEESGGFDLTITPDDSGNITGGEISAAFADAFEQAAESTGEKLVFAGSIMIRQENVSIWQFFVRFVTFLLCSILASLIYYGKTEKSMVLSNAAGVLVLSLLFLLPGLAPGAARLALTALLLGTAMTSLNLEEIPEDEAGNRESGANSFYGAGGANSGYGSNGTGSASGSYGAGSTNSGYGSNGAGGASGGNGSYDAGSTNSEYGSNGAGKGSSSYGAGGGYGSYGTGSGSSPYGAGGGNNPYGEGSENNPYYGVGYGPGGESARTQQPDPEEDTFYV